MYGSLKILRLKGQEILPYIPDLARLRIEIFKDYPYLYVGDLEYETHYLQSYTQCPESVAVIVLDNNEVVGISTAIPMQFESMEFQQPFIESGLKIQDVFYFGESLLLHKYRGKNVYRQYFHEREAAARKYGAKITAFCAVERAKNDSRRPKNYVPLDTIWGRYGYEKHPELCAYYEWKEIGEGVASAKPLIFWLKTL